MINITNNMNNKLPPVWLLGFFIVLFVSLSVVNLPATLVRDKLNNSGWNVQTISGTIWNAEIKGAGFAGEYWSELTLSTLKTPLFLGSLKVSFDAKDTDKHIAGIVETGDEEQILLKSFTGSMPVYFSHDGVSYYSLLTMNSDLIELGSNGICKAGQFDISAEFPIPFLVRLPVEMPILKGLGRCQNGQISAFASANRDGIELALKTDITSEKQQLTIDLVLPDILSNNINVLNELTENGFRKTVSGWQLVTEIS